MLLVIINVSWLVYEFKVINVFEYDITEFAQMLIVEDFKPPDKRELCFPFQIFANTCT